MISEIVRSRANIDNGARGSTSNFFHGLFLAAALFLVPGLLNTIPLSVLAAMLLVTAWRLASPSEFAKVFRIGSDQFAIFVVTMILTVSVDLLVGVSAGILLKLLLHVVRGLRLRDFLSPGAESRVEAGTLYIDVKGAAVFSNFLKIQGLIVSASGEVERVVVNFADAGLVDHTTLERLHSLSRTMGGRAIEFTGLDVLKGVSGHELATRFPG